MQSAPLAYRISPKHKTMDAKLVKAAKETGASWYNYNVLLSYNKAVNLVIKERGLGGTLGMKGIGIREYLHTGGQFVWFRTCDVDVDEVCGHRGATFFSDLKDIGININATLEGEKGRDGLITDGAIKIDGKIAGYVLPLYAWETIKGTDYAGVKWAFYDEFIPAEHKRIGFDVPKALANMCETVMRTRDTRLIMVANSLTKSSPLLRALGFGGISDFGYYVNKNPDKELDEMAILHYCQSPKTYKEKHAASTAGKIARLLGQEGVILDNKFETGANTYLPAGKKKPPMILDCILHGKTDSVRVYTGGINGHTVYIMEDRDKLAYMRYRRTFDRKLVSQYVTLADKAYKDYILYAIQAKQVIFESEYAESVLYEMI